MENSKIQIRARSLHGWVGTRARLMGCPLIRPSSTFSPWGEGDGFSGLPSGRALIGQGKDSRCIDLSTSPDRPAARVPRARPRPRPRGAARLVLAVSAGLLAAIAGIRAGVALADAGDAVARTLGRSSATARPARRSRAWPGARRRLGPRDSACSAATPGGTRSAGSGRLVVGEGLRRAGAGRLRRDRRRGTAAGAPDPGRGRRRSWAA